MILRLALLLALLLVVPFALAAGCGIGPQAYLLPLLFMHNNQPHVILTTYDVDSDEGYVIYRLPTNPAAPWKLIDRRAGSVHHAVSHGGQLWLFHPQTASIFAQRDGELIGRALALPGEWSVRASVHDARGRLLVFGVYDHALAAARWDDTNQKWQALKPRGAPRVFGTRLVAFRTSDQVYVALREPLDAGKTRGPVELYRLADESWQQVSSIGFVAAGFQIVTQGRQGDESLLLVGLTSRRKDVSGRRSMITYRTGQWDHAGEAASIRWGEQQEVLDSGVRFSFSFLHASLLSAPDPGALHARRALLLRTTPQSVELYSWGGERWAQGRVPGHLNSHQMIWLFIGGLTLSLTLIFIGGTLYRSRLQRIQGLSRQQLRTAPISRRVAAHTADVLLLAPLWLLLAFFVGAFDLDKLRLETLQLLIVVANLLFIAYGTVCEGRWGATPGKWLAGIHVETEDGKPCAPRAAFTRNLFRLLDGGLLLPPLALVGLALMTFTRKSRRLGDIFGRTIVVRTGAKRLDDESLRNPLDLIADLARAQRRKEQHSEKRKLEQKKRGGDFRPSAREQIWA